MSVKVVVVVMGGAWGGGVNVNGRGGWRRK